MLYKKAIIVIITTIIKVTVRKPLECLHRQCYTFLPLESTATDKCSLETVGEHSNRQMLSRDRWREQQQTNALSRPLESTATDNCSLEIVGEHSNTQLLSRDHWRAQQQTNALSRPLERTATGNCSLEIVGECSNRQLLSQYHCTGPSPLSATAVRWCRKSDACYSCMFRHCHWLPQPTLGTGPNQGKIVRE